MSSSVSIDVKPGPPTRPRPPPKRAESGRDDDDEDKSSLPPKPKSKWGLGKRSTSRPSHISRGRNHSTSSRNDSSRRKDSDASAVSSQASSISEISVDDDDRSDDSTSVLGAAVPEATQLYSARLLMSLFATMLLWGTSLNFVVAVVQLDSVIRIPDLRTDVVDNVWALLNETFEVKSAYADCVADYLTICNRSLYRNLETEAARVATAEAANTDRVQTSLDTATACATAHSTALAAIQAWQKLGVDVATTPRGNDSHYKQSATCSAEDIQRLKDSTGDLTGQKDATYNLIERYATLSSETIALLGERMDARREYDTAYVSNKTDALGLKEVELVDMTLDLELQNNLHLASIDYTNFLNCATLTGNASECPNGASALAQFEQAQAELMAQYYAGMEQYQDTVAHLQAVAEQAEQQLTDAAAAVEQVNDWVNNEDFFNEFAGDGIFEKLDIPTPDLSAGWSLDGVEDNLPDLTLPEIDTTALDQHVDDFQANLDQATQGVQDSTSQLVQDVTDVELEILDDYDPPPIDARAEQQEHDEATDEFKRDSAVNLNALDKTQVDDDVDYTPELSDTNWTAPSVRKDFDLSWFTFKDFVEQEFPVDEIVAFLSTIVSLFVGFDNAWRILRTVSIMRRFWGRSALEIAPIDMQTDYASKSAATRAFSPVQAAAMLATHPVVMASVFVLFAILVVSGAAMIYDDFLFAYLDGCTKTADVGGQQVMVAGGTLLVKNVYSIAFNYAAFEGNRDRLDGLDSYETARLTACATNSESSTNDQQRLQSDLTATVAAHGRTREEVELMRRCYDLDEIDVDFSLGLVTDVLTDEVYGLLSTTLAEPACDEPISNATLDDGVFDCERLPECEIGCGYLSDDQQQDNTNLWTYSFVAMCTAEHWFHAVVLRMAFASVIYVFINIGRIVAVMGLNRLMWRWLNTGIFAFLGSADAEGHTDVDEEELGRKLQAALRWMQWAGAALVLLAILLQMVWAIPATVYLPKLAAANLEVVS